MTPPRSLLPHAPRPDPELWRAVHEQPLALAASAVGRTARHRLAIRTPHGMPADRLAMAALLQITEMQSRRPPR